MMAELRHRCTWAENDPLFRAYHDEEWGVPEHDSRALWEKLMLDGFQAGLAWITILRKREAFRQAFQGFKPEVVAEFGEADVTRLLADPGIVRSCAKIEAAIGNARAYLAMADAGEDFSTFVWSMAGGAPIRSAGSDIPVKTPLSEEISKEQFGGYDVIEAKNLNETAARSAEAPASYPADARPGPGHIRRQGRGAAQASAISVCRRRYAPCAAQRSCARTGP